MNFVEVLRDSFIVLKKEPKLFLPKIFLALLWGSLLLYYVNLFKRVQEIKSVSAEVQAVLLKGVFVEFVLLCFVFFVFFVVDTIINSAYPLMIKKYLSKKKFSVLSEIIEVLKNFFAIVLPVIAVSVIVIIALIPFVVLFSFFSMQNNSFFSLLSALLVLIVAFLLTVIFYFIYPVASIERKGLHSVVCAAKKSFRNLKEASFGTFVLSVLSLISAFLVSFSEATELTVLALIIFVFLRIVTAVLATYSMVLNPLLYFKE
jgi:hypothetical protein